MSFDATYDACVLHPAGLRDLLVRLALTGMFRAHWSEDILDEMVRSIHRRRPDLTSAQLERTRALMCDAVPDCLTTGYEALIDGIKLPDPDDRHVLAAAIRSGSQVIVTENTVDFPADVLERYDIEAQTPDVFVLHLIDLSPTTVFGVIDADIARWQLHAGPDSADVPAELGQHLLATRAWLDQRGPQTPTWPHRRSHRELVARRAELDDILDNAPSDQQHLIEHLRNGEPRLLNDTAETLTDIVEHQRNRRSWILEHWPHIVEYAEVTQTLDAGLWGPDIDRILDHLDPDPGSALANSIDTDEPWIRLAIGRLAPSGQQTSTLKQPISSTPSRTTAADQGRQAFNPSQTNRCRTRPIANETISSPASTTPARAHPASPTSAPAC